MRHPLSVIAGLSASKDARERAGGPAISLRGAQCPPKRDARVKPAHDDGEIGPISTSRRLRRELECGRDLVDRRLLDVAHLHAAEAEQAAALARRFGHVLADLAQPALEGCRIGRRLGIHERSGLLQSLDALPLHLGRLDAGELGLEPIARGAAAIGCEEIIGDRLDQRIGVGARLHQRAAAGEALLQQAPKPARVGRGDGHSGHHHALQQEFPLVRCKARLVGHRMAPLFGFAQGFVDGLVDGSAQDGGREDCNGAITTAG